MSTYPPQVTERAAEILKTARVATSKLNYTGFIQWKDRAQQTKAFMLFNEHSGQGPIYTQGVADFSRVFNWLMDVVMQGVEVGQMSIEE